MSKSFQPHSYASALQARGDMASESKLLHRWTGTHWQVIEDEEAEVAAYHWLVAHSPDFVSGANAKQAKRPRRSCANVTSECLAAAGAAAPRRGCGGGCGRCGPESRPGPAGQAEGKGTT